MRSKSALNALIDSSGKSIDMKVLSTNVTTKYHPVHRWFNFIAGFSPEFIHGCFDMCKSNQQHLVLLDPFSGCGTAPVAASLLGIESHAYEAHPFFAIISEAKANGHLYCKDIKNIKSAIKEGISKIKNKEIIYSESAQKFLGKMFKDDDLKALYSAQFELKNAGLGENPLAILILSRMLDYCCLAATDGIYKAPNSKKKTISPEEALSNVIENIENDERYLIELSIKSNIYNSTSENMFHLKDGCIDIVVTSPPYLNNFDFAEMTRMYLYFWGLASSWGEITDRVRSKLIVNTTTSLKGHKEKQEFYRSHINKSIIEEVDLTVKNLSIKRYEKSGKKEYNLLVYPYLSQMISVLKECRRVLSSGSPFHMMVSDAALYGVHLPVPQWIAQIMRDSGFVDVECEMVRPRGHRWILKKREGSTIGLGEYHIYGRAS